MINPVLFCSKQSRSLRISFPSVMKIWGSNMIEPYTTGLRETGRQPAGLRPSSLCLVSEHELRSLRAALSNGTLPLDFEAKLIRLSEGDLTHGYIAQNCRIFAALLLAAWDGSFKEASHADCELLLRVLAYVRKDDDAIADYKTGGLVDDQQEVRAATQQLGPLLTSFKAWRLRHQVPRMWLHN
jgi:hypothetical protein